MGDRYDDEALAWFRETPGRRGSHRDALAAAFRRVAAEARVSGREEIRVEAIAACESVRASNKSHGDRDPYQDFYARADGATECRNRIRAIGTKPKGHDDGV